MILFAALTFLAFMFFTVAYVLSQALLGHWCGVAVTQVAFGYDLFGRCLVRWRGRRWEYRIGWLPTGGYTKFKSMEDDPGFDDRGFDDPGIETQSKSTSLTTNRSATFVIHDESSAGGCTLEQATTPVKLALVLIGPFIQFLFAFLLMVVPVWQRAPQLEFSPSQEANQLVPSGAPGLRVSERVATISGQCDLIANVSVEALKRFALFQPLTGWGGYLAWLVTGGSAGAKTVYIWMTFVGLTSAMLGAFNLMPLGGLNGGHVVRFLLEPIFRVQRVEKWFMRFTFYSVLYLLVVMFRLFYADLQWLVGHFAFSSVSV